MLTQTQSALANGFEASLNRRAFLGLTLAGLALASCSGSTTNADPMVGTLAPALKGMTFEGNGTFFDPKDGPLMVVFLAHWCPHCNAEIPRLLEWKASGTVPDGLRIVGVSICADRKLPNFPPDQWLSNKGWSWPVLDDRNGGDRRLGELGTAFAIESFPCFVVIGSDGRVKAKVSGEVTTAELSEIASSASNA